MLREAGREGAREGGKERRAKDFSDQYKLTSLISRELLHLFLEKNYTLTVDSFNST